MISAKRILRARKDCHLQFEHLKKLGVVLKRARYFITCNGKYYDAIHKFNDSFISENLFRKKTDFLFQAMYKPLYLIN